MSIQLHRRRSSLTLNILSPLVIIVVVQSATFAQTDWPNTGNDKGATRYSTLKQVDRNNVKNLHVAWTYNTGDAGPGNTTTMQCTPIVVNGVMYVTTVKSKVVALDAATGREIWKYDPYADYTPAKIYHSGGGVNRGVAYWEGAARVERRRQGRPRPAGQRRRPFDFARRAHWQARSVIRQKRRG
jgi:quinoprotein glucose dehydrogenase